MWCHLSIIPATQEVDHSSRPAQIKAQDPLWKKTLKVLWHSSSGRVQE
jgi:hypothetical protein